MANDTQVMQMQDSTFMEFFVEELQDIYWAEKHLAPALEKLSKASTTPELISAFEKHHSETLDHINIVENIFRLLEEEPKTKKCKAMDGLLKEADEIMEDTEKDTFLRDAALILAAQKVEHYEIATYGTLRVFAKYLKRKEIQTLIEQILNNEKYTDVSLTKVAESFINQLASEE